MTTKLTRTLMLTAALATAGIGSAVAWAGQGQGAGGWGGPVDPEARWEMMQSHRQLRFELLEKALQLRPEQKAAWDEYVNARKALGPLTPEQMKTWRDAMINKNPIERQQLRIERMEQHLQQMKASLVPMQKFYGSLDADQKATFDKFFQWGPRGGHGMRGQGMGGPGMGAGMGGPGMGGQGPAPMAPPAE